ncbi:fructokinase [Caldanaerobius fijiensis DSM 17918]|uniref:Fructokinase n=1 Tax=Caldanaerobius fijiensis DSM 17918 TaxID=1121256 RepID=A0A1M4SR44_9THEO|nr:PfkB family carbohydrate kinase [Caldanaerobius fijiensis]SHE34679.1 fructokinase [Caldanaerobius fijiensis DSM 17918]
MPDIISIGEILIDFVSMESGVTLAQSPGFLKAAGGAPANVAVAVSKLGVKSGFIGTAGNDPFGRFLKDTLNSYGVDTCHMDLTDEARTTLAFVSLTADGDRDFVFYRHPGADMMLRKEKISEDYIKSAHIFHFGSISLIDEPARTATLYAIDIAKKHGLIISYDPNLRLNLWPDEETARKTILSTLNLPDILKVSEVELEFLTGIRDIDSGLKALKDKTSASLILVTRGIEGVDYVYRGERGHVETFKDVKAIDATGAGDAFVAGVLYGIHERINEFKDGHMTSKALQDILRIANACGTITVTKKGAIPALPTIDEVKRFLSERLER